MTAPKTVRIRCGALSGETGSVAEQIGHGFVRLERDRTDLGKDDPRSVWVHESMLVTA